MQLTLLVYMCFNWLFASADNLDPLALRPNTWLPMLPFLSLFFLHLLSSSHPSPFSLFLSLSSLLCLFSPFPHPALPLFLFAPPGHFLFIVL